MQTVIAAAVFPRGQVGVSLMKALLLYLIEENKLLGGTTTSSDQETLTKVIPFARASFVSSIVSQGDRLKVCAALDLVIGNNANPNLQVPTASCNMIQQARPRNVTRAVPTPSNNVDKQPDVTRHTASGWRDYGQHIELINRS